MLLRNLLPAIGKLASHCIIVTKIKVGYKLVLSGSNLNIAPYKNNNSSV